MHPGGRKMSIAISWTHARFAGGRRNGCGGRGEGSARRSLDRSVRELTDSPVEREDPGLLSVLHRHLGLGEAFLDVGANRPEPGPAS